MFKVSDDLKAKLKGLSVLEKTKIFYSIYKDTDVAVLVERLRKVKLLKFDKKNKKLTDIANFTLCHLACMFASLFCAKFCYAKRGQMAYNMTVMGYTLRYILAKFHPVEFKQLVIDSIQANYDKFKIMRVHVAGDFFSQEYMDLWFEIARKYPEKKFMSYTKAFNFDFSNKPENYFILFSGDISNKHESIPAVTEKFNQVNGYCYALPKGDTAVPEIPGMKSAFTCNGDCTHCLKCCAKGNGNYVVIPQH